MSQKITTLTKSPENYTVIEVDQDISFMLDSSDVNYTGSASPTVKSTEMSRKTYSKKHPVSYNPCVSFSDDSISVISSSATRGKKQPFKSSPKCTSNSVPNTEKGIRRKRLADTDSASECPVHKRGRKKNSDIKALPKIINGRITDRPSKILHSDRPSSPDSDIEIVDIVEPGTSRSSFSRDLDDSRDRLSDVSHKKNSAKSLTSILKPCYPSKEDITITEVDTAPAMPLYSVIPNSLGESSRNTPSSMKWLSANGTIDFPPVQNGGTCSAKESALKYADKYNLYIPEMKISQNENVPQKKPKGKRELKKLFENLNEISWANEKSFKQMLTSTTDGRHSERITAKVSENEKNMRRLKSGALRNLKLTSTRQKPNMAKKNSANMVLKRAKYGKLKPRVLVKTVQRRKVPLNKVNKIKSVMKRKKLNVKKPVSKPNKVKVVRRPGVKTNKVKVIKSVNKASKMNVAKSVVKPNKISYPNADMKPQKSILKKPKSILKPDKSLMKSGLKSKNVPKNGPRVKIVPAFNENSSSSTSDFQNIAGNCSLSAANSSLFSAFEKNMLKDEDINNFSDSSFVKEFENFEVSDELEILKSCIGVEDKVFETAIKKGSKLKVRVEPIEHTKLWGPDFFEAFKKHILDEAFLQTFEKREQESISTMFQELQEACFNPQNNVKPMKRKKPEEEALRSSVRQSEGAFRYKEIVVKKHENYMQFVLVPNSCKRNSLTIEAMKELRDAFLLAKKDPNCRAVLLNSSGTYFCTGIDLSLLVGSNKKQVAEEMASTIRDLVLTLSTFTKPVIAAVNGTAVGFGVSLLTYCDVVLASDKATFCIPATRLGYLPEGAITLTLPQVVGSGVATEMLLYGRRLTAEQALRHGLVSEVLWPTQLMNEVVPRIQTIVSQPLQVMEATKTMVRCHLWDKLKTHIDREWRLLPPLWLEAQCQHNIKRTLQTGWLVD